MTMRVPSWAKTLWHSIRAGTGLSLGVDARTIQPGLKDELLVETGLGILRFGAALSLLIFGPTSLREGSFDRSVLAIHVALYCLVHIGAMASRARVSGKDGRTDRILTYLQIWIDVVFASFVVVFAQHAETAAVAFYAPALLSVAHRSPSARNWLSLTAAIILLAVLSITACAWAGGMVHGMPLMPISSTGIWQLSEALVLRGMGLAAGSAVLRLYRIGHFSHFRSLAEAHESRARAQAEKRKLSALLNGMECGISVLTLNGTIEAWNRKQSVDCATPDAVAKMKAGLPCYKVYHDQDEPCRWCGMVWKKVMEDGDQKQVVRHYEYGAGVDLPLFAVDCDDLQTRIDAGRNWALSSQIEAGCPPQPGLHLFHMGYGLRKGADGRPDRIIETVVDVTATVLDMPFLLRDFKKQYWSEEIEERAADGVPPIGIVGPPDAQGQTRLLRMNVRKALRARLEGAPAPDPKDRVDWLCHDAYGRPIACDPAQCPVKAVLEDPHHRVKRSLLNHPSHALVTAVPLFGPESTPTIRAVVEFVDDISSVVRALDAIREMNRFDDKTSIIRAGLDAMRAVAQGSTTDARDVVNVAWLEVDEETQSIGVRSTPYADRARPWPFRFEDVPLYSEMKDAVSAGVKKGVNEGLGIMEVFAVKRSADVGSDARLPAGMQRFARHNGLGAAVFLPVADRRGRILAIVDLEQRHGATPIEDDRVAQCCTIANAMAGAIIRAEAHRQARVLAIQRRVFLQTVKRTVDKSAIDDILQGILRKAAQLLPGTPVAAYTMDYAFEIEKTALALKPEDVKMIYRYGTGSPEFAVRLDKWERGKTWRHPLGKTLAMIKTGQAFDDPVPVGPKTLCCEGTRFLYAVPFTYRGETLGCLVGESTQVKSEGFAAETMDMLNLMGQMIGLLVGRSRMMAEHLGSMTSSHGVLSPQELLDRLQRALAAQDAPPDAIRQAGLDVVRYLRDTIEDLGVVQAVYQVETGKNPLSAAPCNIEDLINKAIRSVSRKLRSGVGQLCRVSIPHSGATPVGHERSIVWIISELILNASKNVPEDQPSPRPLCSVSVENTGSEVIVEVKDTYQSDGCGIAAAPRHPVDFKGNIGGLGLRFARVLMRAQEGELTHDRSDDGVFGVTLRFRRTDVGNGK